MFNKIKQLFIQKKPKEGYPYLNGRSLIICDIWMNNSNVSYPSLYDEKKDVFLVETSIFEIQDQKIIAWDYTRRITNKPQSLSRKDQKIFFNRNIKEFKYEL